MVTGPLQYMVQLCQLITICDLGFSIYLRFQLSVHSVISGNYKKYLLQKGIAVVVVVPINTFQGLTLCLTLRVMISHGLLLLLLLSYILQPLPVSVFLSISRAGATPDLRAHSCVYA